MKCTHCNQDIKDYESYVVVNWIKDNPTYHLDCRLSKEVSDKLDKLIPIYRSQFS